MGRYQVGNNTDYKDCPLYEGDSYSLAVRAWNKVRPRKDAGLLYSAYFQGLCSKCGRGYRTVNPKNGFPGRCDACGVWS